MDTVTRLQLNMAGVSTDFCKAHPDPSPGGQAMVAQLEDRMARAEALVQQQQASKAAVTAATTRKGTIRQVSHGRLLSLVSMARTAAKTEPGITLHLRLPKGRTDDATFLALGRVAVTEATAWKATFVKVGMPEDLLDLLTADLDQFEAEFARQRQAIGIQVGTGAELRAVTREVMGLLKHIDALQRLRFSNQPDLAAAWKSARNVAYPAPSSTSEGDESKSA